MHRQASCVRILSEMRREPSPASARGPDSNTRLREADRSSRHRQPGGARRAVAPGSRVYLSSAHAFDSQTAMLGPDGRFEFQGLSAGDYEMSAAVRGYELPAKVRPKNEDFSDREAYR